MTNAMEDEGNSMPHSGEYVLERLGFLSREVLGINLDQYLIDNGDRHLFGLIINKIRRQFEPLFGNPPEQFYKNAPFVESLAGYAVDVGRKFPGLGLNADVFLIAQELLGEDDLSVDTIILHELIHVLIDSGWLDRSTLKPNAKDKYHGERLYAKTDKENQHVTRHTEEFCILLASAAQRLYEIDKRYRDRVDVIDKAMRADLRGNLK